MPSQEEYLDNLLKGIENEETTESVEEKKKPEPAEQDAPQIDMSDMDDLLQSALNAQKEDAVSGAVPDTASVPPLPVLCSVAAGGRSHPPT